MGGWLNRLSTRPPTPLPPQSFLFFFYPFQGASHLFYCHFRLSFCLPLSRSHCASLFLCLLLFFVYSCPACGDQSESEQGGKKREEGALRQGRNGWTGCLGSLSAGLGNREWGIGWMERRVEEGIEGQAWINREVGRDVGNGKIEGSWGRESGEGWRKICQRKRGGRG